MSRLGRIDSAATIKGGFRPLSVMAEDEDVNEDEIDNLPPMTSHHPVYTNTLKNPSTASFAKMSNMNNNRHMSAVNRRTSVVYLNI